MSNDKHVSFYQHNLQQFGASALGVGWKNEEAQRIRFKKLYALIEGYEQSPFSLNDIGCGVGDFANFLATHTDAFTYAGYDVLPDMIQKAKARYKNDFQISFTCIQEADEMTLADFTVASGIFNIRFDVSDENWLKEILATIEIMNSKSTRGFAFNVLSKYSDPEYRKKELYYADPLYLFDHCKRFFSKNVALLHDYDQYDFTVIIRK